ncbi:motile sperm domain-containing protein 2 [Orussus abietinus]|uniref:motile sperm domain-containing protein 2 n=1 Tax=Orussus abietinus TaxID=222816 RepID=UPI0006259C86|nr:motile sperm domain-containing protein 2 [Orussus abietinus]XP_012286683.1 motile sperm domain-containing protein 2 [Orussus abietinus]
MGVTAEEVAELRDSFFKKIGEEGPEFEGFHPVDIARITEQDTWLKRFLEHNERNMNESLRMLWECCAWRKKFGTNDISEETVRRDYLEDGICYSHGRDKDGRKLFIIKSKQHVKGARDFKELQRCIVYWFERLEREENGKPVSLFFDMADAGLSNLDMEFTQYLIGLFKTYYPNFLNYIIIFDMPWVLNAAFKIIKSWLPAKAIPKIKFVNKLNIKEFVDQNDILKSWGGTNDYVFKFVSETQSNAVMNGKLESKKVHFAGGSPIEEQPSGFDDQTNNDTLLSVEPDVIVLYRGKAEPSGTITLKNLTTEKCVTYKIKTTTPEKFKVHPRIGILRPGEKVDVVVMLQPGYEIRGWLHNIKFLVMCLPITESEMNKELAEFWKTADKPAENHKRRCTEVVSETGESQKLNSILSSSHAGTDYNADRFFTKMSQLEDCHRKLQGELRSSKRLQFLSIVLTVLMAIVVTYILRADIRSVIEEQSCRAYRE